MIRVQFLTARDCEHCERVRALLRQLQRERPDLRVEELEATSPAGLRASIEHGVLIAPGVIVNGQFVAMGVISEAALRQALTRASRNLP